jgi:hypothetical protein
MRARRAGSAPGIERRSLRLAPRLDRGKRQRSHLTAHPLSWRSVPCYVRGMRYDQHAARSDQHAQSSTSARPLGPASIITARGIKPFRCQRLRGLRLVYRLYVIGCQRAGCCAVASG